MVHVIIAGCGRVGAQLATTLDAAGHEVVIVDKNPAAFRRLDENFGGTTMVGFAFDRPTLESAGIRQAQAFIAVTNGDNSNVVSARAARDAYGVEHAIARIYDPERAMIYERLGITTIASARWTTEVMLRELLPETERIEGALGPGNGEVALLTVRVAAGVHNLAIEAVNRPGTILVAAVTREGATKVPTPGVLLEGGDQLHVAVQRSALDEAQRHLAALAGGRS